MLRDSLVVKGGTALPKCYFGDYRFSEDLDFSGLEGVPAGEELELVVNETCEVAARLLDAYAPVDIASERYTERAAASWRPGGVQYSSQVSVAEPPTDPRHDRGHDG